MISLRLSTRPGSALSILCLGAHSDDIEIGCGGTVLELLSRHRRVEIHWVVFSADAEREAEARRSSRSFLGRARRATVAVQKFRNGYFPYVGAEIKDYFETLKRRLAPDLIFTHCRDDRHQDHRLLWELTWNTFRNHMILEYEIPKYEGDLGSPNVFVPLTRAHGARKVRYLLRHFASQRDKHWFTPDLFWSVMRLRGMESCAASGYAEAFYARKAVLA
jgi:LmbE family N-acetylglucosaminyl deacetylase